VELLRGLHGSATIIAVLGKGAMIGAICGDVIGSVHEAAATKTKDFRCSFKAAGSPTTGLFVGSAGRH
jgi:hypothetical protein